MKRICLCFLIILGVFAQWSQAAYPHKAQRGVLDLSRWAPKKDGPVKLDGEWRFYWNQFKTPASLFSQAEDEVDYYPVPKVWEGSTANGEHIDTYGFGTYALKVILPHRPAMLAFKLPTAGTAYRLYINGQLVAQAGEPGRTASQTIAKYRPQIVTYLAQSRELEIVCHISNFNYHYGGLWYSIQLGRPADIYKIRENNTQRDFFAGGVFFIMFLLHFMLFLLRKEDRLSLFFGLTCLVLWVRQICVGEAIILNVVPDLTFTSLVRLEFASFYLALPLLAAFLKLAFAKEFNSLVLKIIVLVGLGSSLIVALTPAAIFSKTLTFYQICTVIGILYGLYVILSAVSNRSEGAKVLLIGTFVMFATAINDMLYARQLINTGYWVDMGLLVFIFSQSYLVNYRYSRAFITIERISTDLEAKNRALEELAHTLEDKVAERTQDLNRALIDLKKAAMTDALTGLPNRRNMRQLMELEENRFKRGRSLFVLALLDIDKFKSFNDTYGHDIGDEVLKAVANTAKNTIRLQDHIARWGGEEFVFLFPETDLAGSLIVAERIRKAIEATQVMAANQALSVTVTIGLCEYDLATGVEGCLKLADEALYKGKQQGRNQVVQALKPDAAA